MDPIIRLVAFLRKNAAEHFPLDSAASKMKVRFWLPSDPLALPSALYRDINNERRRRGTHDFYSEGSPIIRGKATLRSPRRAMDGAARYALNN